MPKSPYRRHKEATAPEPDSYVYACVRRHDKKAYWYVASTPTATEDWGWTTLLAEAMPLSNYWARRFLSTARQLGWDVGLTPAD